MKPDPLQAAREIVSLKPKGDGRDWARAILARARGGLPVTPTIREMAERALNVSKESGL